MFSSREGRVSMKPIKFKEQTVIIAEHHPEYLPLPAYQYNDPKGRIVFCWKMTWRERFKVLFTGLLWHQVLTFHNSLQPQLLETEKPDMDN